MTSLRLHDNVLFSQSELPIMIAEIDARTTPFAPRPRICERHGISKRNDNHGHWICRECRNEKARKPAAKHHRQVNHDDPIDDVQGPVRAGIQGDEDVIAMRALVLWIDGFWAAFPESAGTRKAGRYRYHKRSAWHRLQGVRNG